jgi:hypothetical protein
MEGFDLVLISSLFAQPQFQRKYGVPLPDGTYTIESKWQIALNLAVQAGSIIGLTINGWASERFGYRKTICAAVRLCTPWGGWYQKLIAARLDDRRDLHPVLRTKHRDVVCGTAHRGYPMGDLPDPLDRCESSRLERDQGLADQDSTPRKSCLFVFGTT